MPRVAIPKISQAFQNLATKADEFSELIAESEHGNKAFDDFEVDPVSHFLVHKGQGFICADGFFVSTSKISITL